MKTLILLLLTSVSLTSCYHVYYAPNTVNPALLKEKDEMRINTLYSGGNLSDMKGGELQFAYAPAREFGIQLNGLAAGHKEGTGPGAESGTGTYFEVAGGYFKPLDRRKRIIFETYAGIGSGTVDNQYGDGDFSKVGFTKFYLQPAFGYRSDYFEMAFVPKMSRVNWRVKQEVMHAPGHEDDAGDLAHIKSNRGFYVFEPGFLLRGGAQNMKAQLAISFSNHSSFMYDYGGITENLNMSLGLSFSFNARKKNP